MSCELCCKCVVEKCWNVWEAKFLLYTFRINRAPQRRWCKSQLEMQGSSGPPMSALHAGHDSIRNKVKMQYETEKATS